MKNKKIVIPVICAVIIIALLAGSFGIYFSLLNNVPERAAVETRSSRFFSHSRSYALTVSPYDTDCVFETYEGLQNYYLKHRHNAEGVEIVLHLTKDNKLVVFSGDLSDYSNSHILYGKDATISSLTLEELRKVNLAYNFADSNGQMFYKTYNDDENINLVNILTFEEMINWFNSQRADMPLFAIKLDESIKNNANAVIDEIYNCFNSIDCNGNYFVSSDNKAIADYIDSAYPEMLRSATESEAKKLFVNCLLNKDVDVSYEIVYQSCNEGVFGNFSSEKFINYVNNANIALILKDADESEVSTLISYKVDGIATSDPETVKTLIKEDFSSSRS